MKLNARVSEAENLARVAESQLDSVKSRADKAEQLALAREKRIEELEALLSAERKLSARHLAQLQRQTDRLAETTRAIDANNASRPLKSTRVWGKAANETNKTTDEANNAESDSSKSSQNRPNSMKQQRDFISKYGEEAELLVASGEPPPEVQFPGNFLFLCSLFFFFKKKEQISNFKLRFHIIRITLHSPIKSTLTHRQP